MSFFPFLHKLLLVYAIIKWKKEKKKTKEKRNQSLQMQMKNYRIYRIIEIVQNVRCFFFSCRFVHNMCIVADIVCLLFFSFRLILLSLSRASKVSVGNGEINKANFIWCKCILGISSLFIREKFCIFFFSFYLINQNVLYRLVFIFVFCFRMKSIVLNYDVKKMVIPRDDFVVSVLEAWLRVCENDR